MREFLLTVSANSLTEKTSFAFIVSKNQTPPQWSDVENNQAKITRAFDGSDLSSREIYFSVTDLYSVPENRALVDLSTDSESKYPGIMTSNTTYYVHAYQSGEHETTSAAVTTASYPANLPAEITSELNSDGESDGFIRAMWGMSMWSTRADGSALTINDEKIAGTSKTLNLRTIEIKNGEVVYFPMRTIPPVAPTNSCILSPSRVIWQGNKENGNTNGLTVLSNSQSAYHSTHPADTNSVLFINQFSGVYFDVVTQMSSDYTNVEIVTNCPDGPASNFYFYGFQITAITE